MNTSKVVDEFFNRDRDDWSKKGSAEYVDPDASVLYHKHMQTERPEPGTTEEMGFMQSAELTPGMLRVKSIISDIHRGRWKTKEQFLEHILTYLTPESITRMRFFDSREGMALMVAWNDNMSDQAQKLTPRELLEIKNTFATMPKPDPRAIFKEDEESSGDEDVGETENILDQLNQTLQAIRQKPEELDKVEEWTRFQTPVLRDTRKRNATNPFDLDFEIGQPVNDAQANPDAALKHKQFSRDLRRVARGPKRRRRPPRTYRPRRPNRPPGRGAARKGRPALTRRQQKLIREAENERRRQRQVKWAKKKGLTVETAVSGKGKPMHAIVYEGRKYPVQFNQSITDGSNQAVGMNDVVLAGSTTDFKYGAMPTMHNQMSSDPIRDFAKTLIEPGALYAPYITSSGILPMPTSLSRGTDSMIVTNNSYTIIATSVGTANANSSAMNAMYPGYGKRTGLTTSSTMNSSDCTGGSGEFSTIFGGTTLANKIFPWSVAIDMVILQPGSVIAGNIWVGNLPFKSFETAQLSDLLRYATQIKGETAGQVYSIQSCQENRDAVFFSNTNPNYANQMERVSYIIFSPNSVGSITGAPPATYTLQLFPRTNYVWTPINSPQLTAMTEAQVREYVQIKYSAEELNTLHRFGSLATTYIGRSSSNSEYDIAENVSTVTNGISEELAPLSLMSYASQIQDCDFIEKLVEGRWGDPSSYPTDIAESITNLLADLSILISLFGSVTKSNAEELERWNALPTKVVWRAGKQIRIKDMLAEKKRATSTDKR